MKKEQIKKILIPSSIFILICIIVFSILTIYQYHTYITTVNTTIENIVDEIRAQYPQVSEEKLIKIINGSINKKDASTLKKYGYTDNKVAYIKELEKSMKHSTIINLTVLIFIGIIGILILLLANKKQEKKIEEINHYLKTINNRNYQLKIEENTEDELSKLRNELYKTTVLLKESAENSEQEKINLSNSLADISHQLKTPLTSITIMLDNLKENPNMDENTKQKFIFEISKQIDWINWLVISMLNLSKLDANVVQFYDEKINLNKFITEIVKNLEIPIEIKNQNIIINGDNEASFVGDYKWQQEAVTNIIKNCIEHNKENGTINIKYEENNLFTKISIKDEGIGIEKEDLKHIFERFYKGKNSTENSVGIGLSLSKNIIEKNNGIIFCKSEIGKGTEFIIKYMKKMV